MIFIATSSDWGCVYYTVVVTLKCMQQHKKIKGPRHYTSKGILRDHNQILMVLHFRLCIDYQVSMYYARLYL